MGTTAKVFIVLNLVISLIFAISSFCLFGKKIHWVRQTRAAIEETNTVYQQLTAQVEELTKKLKDAEDKIKSTDNKYEVATTELKNAQENLRKEEALRNSKDAELKTAQSRVTSLEAQNQAKDDRNNSLQASLNGEITKHQAAAKEKDWHQARAIETAAELVEAENEMMQLAKNNAELVRRITLLSTQLEKYVSRYGADPETSANTAGLSINGKVLQVEPKLDLVILSVGEKDKVQKGMEFVISRGNSYITKVRVANVYDAMCSAKILEGMTSKGEMVKISDSASTLD